MSRVVVVTGARAGVGRATAEEFARKGWDVGLVARDPAGLEAAAAGLRARYGVRALAVATDVADAEAVDAAATDIEEELGPIDVWMNVAMATVFAPAHEISPEEFRRGDRSHLPRPGAWHDLGVEADAHAQQRHHR